MKLLVCASLLSMFATIGLPDHGTWQSDYSDGLKAAHQNHWVEARSCFERADKKRRGDSSRPTISIGNPNEPNTWRNGAPYSPKFLLAYCDYRLALDCNDTGAQAVLLQKCGSEFEKLALAGQRSRDTFYFLTVIETKLKDDASIERINKECKPKKGNWDWNVDEEIFMPEELSSIQMVPSEDRPHVAKRESKGSKHHGVEVSASQIDPASPSSIPSNVTVASLPPVGIPHLNSKFAIVIGQDDSQLSTYSYDAQVVADGLVHSAGYERENVLLIQNAGSSTVMDKANALAAKIGQDSVVFLFFAGQGVSIQGKDFLGTPDSLSRPNPDSMISKSALCNVLLSKGARVFSFYEVNRPIEDGFFFGSEVPQVGAISQMEATIPDSVVTTTVVKGHSVGLYAEALVEVLDELRSNRVPIYEFGWQIYNKMKRGNTGTAGGGGHQIPTLPVLNNLASDARF